jgi:hypothetical protein
MKNGDVPIALTVDADTSGLQRQLVAAGQIGEQFARTLATSFEGAAVRGRGLGDVLDRLSDRLQSLALKTVSKSLEQGLSEMFSGLLSGGEWATGRAAAPIASPQVSQQPPAFSRAASVVVNVSTPDVESFRRSETQLAAVIARAAALGQRNL